MKCTESLKKNYQFRIVYNKGKSIANRHLVMYVLRNGLNKNHLGISVSKKVGKSVTRSYVSRIIKESYRLYEQKVKVGYDIVIIARNTAGDISYHELERSFKHLIKKHNIEVWLSARDFDGANITSDFYDYEKFYDFQSASLTGSTS